MMRDRLPSILLALWELLLCVWIGYRGPGVASRQTGESVPKSSGYYLESLDGLRFFAFLLVVFRHIPEAKFSGLSTLNEYG